jgi:hypothetical protein
MLKEICTVIPTSVCILAHEIREEFTELIYANKKFKENFGEGKNFD